MGNFKWRGPLSSRPSFVTHKPKRHSTLSKRQFVPRCAVPYSYALSALQDVHAFTACRTSTSTALIHTREFLKFVELETVLAEPGSTLETCVGLSGTNQMSRLWVFNQMFMAITRCLLLLFVSYSLLCSRRLYKKWCTVPKALYTQNTSP